MKRLAAAVLALFLLATPVAFAGGPTSAILVNPSTGKSASLYYQDTQYNSLMSALGDEMPGADPAAPDLHGGPGGASINITWLIHDVQVWRIDHVFLAEKDGPWVETYTSFEGTINFTQRGIVHRPDDAAAMQKILHNLLDDAKTASPVAAVSAPPAPVPAPTPAAATGLHWGSMLVGLAVGALLVVGFTVLRRRPSDRVGHPAD